MLEILVQRGRDRQIPDQAHRLLGEPHVQAREPVSKPRGAVSETSGLHLHSPTHMCTCKHTKSHTHREILQLLLPQTINS